MGRIISCCIVFARSAKTIQQQFSSLFSKVLFKFRITGFIPATRIMDRPFEKKREIADLKTIRSAMNPFHISKSNIQLIYRNKKRI